MILSDSKMEGLPKAVWKGLCSMYMYIIYNVITKYFYHVSIKDQL